MNNHVMHQKQVDEAIKLKDEGWTYKQIGRKLRVHHLTVYSQLKKNGYPIKKYRRKGLTERIKLRAKKMEAKEKAKIAREGSHIITYRPKNPELPTKKVLIQKYTFLQDLRVVIKWATKEYNLSKPNVELLLYLYGVGLFTRDDFYHYSKVISMFQAKRLDYLIEKGFIKEFRNDGRKFSIIYQLTYKASFMCNKLHCLLVGEKQIAESSRGYKALEKGNQTDGYYVSMIKKMSERNQDGN